MGQPMDLTSVAVRDDAEREMVGLAAAASVVVSENGKSSRRVMVTDLTTPRRVRIRAKTNTIGTAANMNGRVEIMRGFRVLLYDGTGIPHHFASPQATHAVLRCPLSAQAPADPRACNVLVRLLLLAFEGLRLHHVCIDRRPLWPQIMRCIEIGIMSPEHMVNDGDDATCDGKCSYEQREK